MTDPNLFGFLKDAGGWIIPIATFAFGYATKGGVNQNRLDAATESIKSIQAAQASDKEVLTRHQALLETSAANIADIKADVKTMSSQVSVLVARTQISDSQSFQRSTT